MKLNKKIVIKITIIAIILVGAWWILKEETPLILDHSVEDVSLIVDKAEYFSGEEVKITISNNSNSPVWYNKFCPASCCTLWKEEGGKWISVGNRTQCTSSPQSSSDAPDYPTAYDALNPGSNIQETWSMELGYFPINEGTYKISFNYGLEDLPLGEIIYSDEFFLSFPYEPQDFESTILPIK